MLTCLRIVNVSDIIIQYPIIVHFKVQVFSCDLKEKISVPWDLTNTLFVNCALKRVIFRKYVGIAKTYFVIAFGCPPELQWQDSTAEDATYTFTGSGEIKLVLTRRLPLSWLAFMVLEGVR